ncbi:MAG: argininosuccinate synthase [Promethearchaeota archaeon]
MNKIGPSKKKYNRIVLMYSGGLDTSCILKWLIEEYNAEIITFTADLGQDIGDPTRLKYIEEKAKKFGALKTYIMDLKEEFILNYIFPAIKANALYQGIYPLSSSIARYLITKYAVEIAEKEGADAICHASTGMGNDQVRFDVAAKTLNSDIEMLRPMIEWGMSREDELEYAKKHGIPVLNMNKKYSTDENLFGRSTECDILEYPDKIAPEDATEWTTNPMDAPDEPEIVKISFKEGVPISLNDKELTPLELMLKLNKLGNKHGIGRIEHMEDRVVGLKSRETYEVPAAAILIPAHIELEKYVCTKHENSFKKSIDQKWTEMAYDGLWLDPLVDALNAFINEVNIKVTGWVKMQLFKGHTRAIARKSPYGIYDLNLTTYGNGSKFPQEASYGFIELFGLSSRMGYKMKKKAEKDNKEGLEK